MQKHTQAFRKIAFGNCEGKAISKNRSRRGAVFALNRLFAILTLTVKHSFGKIHRKSVIGCNMQCNF